MKTLTFFIALLISYPFVLSAQTPEGMLQKVSVALDGSQWGQAVELFRQAINVQVDKAEMFYWTNVDKTSDVSARMAFELASYYKKNRNYDKAYLFYKELLQKDANNISYLMACAEMEVYRGKEAEALKTYEKVLQLDADNLSANIFIGNYYYLKAEKQKQKIEQDYKKISSPTRMQYARYKDGLHELMATGYGRAKTYLLNVIRQFPSTEVKKTLDKIQLVEKEVR